MDFSFVSADRDALRTLTDRLWPMYRECFAAPPWNETAAEIADFPARLARQTTYPDAYGCVVERGGELAGAVYGWPAPAATPAASDFDRAVRAAVNPQVARLLMSPAVVVAELMVAPAWRRRGLGGALLARFLAGRSHAWLATHPQADAVALYESRGWVRRAHCQVSGRQLVLYTWEAAIERWACAGVSARTGRRRRQK